MPLAEKMLSESWESWTKWPERPLHWYQLSESDFQGKRPWKRWIEHLKKNVEKVLLSIIVTDAG